MSAVVDKKLLSERDICTKFITPALRQVGWDEICQIREEVSFTKGRIIVRGRLVTRGQAKRAQLEVSQRLLEATLGQLLSTATLAAAES